MSIAGKILQETISDEELTQTDLYLSIKSLIPTILDMLDNLIENLDRDSALQLLEVLDNLSTLLNGEGFTYYSQPLSYNKRDLIKMLGQYRDFYSNYENDFATEDMEILNTNTKDLISVLEKIK